MVKKINKSKESDGEFFLKLLMFLLLSSLWVKILDVSSMIQIPIPLGLVIAIIFASREHFQIDRKIEYAMILVGVLVGFWANTGMLITV